MQRMLLGFVLVLCGLAVLSMAAVGPAPTPAAAGPVLQPSPRPTLIPTPDRRGDDYDYADPARMGRITGTVIDLRTGAPAAGRRVVVGAIELTSDSNGNYDTWVPAGQYPIALSISSAEGTAAQGATTATVLGDDVVVIHLFFTSFAPLTPTAPPPPTPAPAVTAVPVATAAPVATRAPAPPVGLPGDLPNTSTNETPASLPVTGNELLDPQHVILGGLALLALGVTVILMPRRAPARATSGASRALRRRKSAEDLLRELLRRDP